jgi:hypothetical protein
MDLTLTALHRLSTELTPSPWPGDAGHRLTDFLTGWRRIGEDPEDPWQADAWVRPRLARLLGVEDRLRPELYGDTLSHIDLRADNIMLTAERVWFVDWAHAQNAAPWVDVAILLGDVISSRADRSDGGDIDVRSVISQHPQLGAVPYPMVWGLQVVMAGALHAMSRQSTPSGLPTIRSWQGRTAETLLGWCERNEAGSGNR